jgi:hypothetical protein
MIQSVLALSLIRSVIGKSIPPILSHCPFLFTRSGLEPIFQTRSVISTDLIWKISGYRLSWPHRSTTGKTKTQNRPVLRWESSGSCLCDSVDTVAANLMKGKTKSWCILWLSTLNRYNQLIKVGSSDTAKITVSG